MAYSCLSTKRTKCMGSRRGPQFGVWIWCILIECLISLPCIFSSCSGVNISVSLHPKGMIEVLYGRPLEIFCIAENNTAEDLELLVGGEIIPTEIYNATTRRLYIENPEKQYRTLYCRNKVTKRNCASPVLVDSTPMNITDFGCVSMNLEILNCSWTSQEIYSRTNYSVTYLFNGNFLQPCIAKRVDTLRYCSWNTSSYPRYMQFELEFTFRLQACNVFGCNEQNFTIDHYSIVKPEPPSNLKVIANDSHSVMLKWNMPFNMDLLNCGVEHKIEYQIAKIDNTAYFHSVDTSSLPLKNRTYNFLLSNLPYAHMQYEVRIYIRSKKAVRSEFWSPFTYIMFYTASERPRRPPDMIAGAFDQSSFENKRVIYVYWKQLEEYEEAGDNFTYEVIATTGSKSAPPIYPEKNKSMSYVILDKASLEGIDVSVKSRNEIGSSYNSSHLYIPPKLDTKALSVPSFTKLAYENGTYKLSWVGINNIDNYTLFWCQHNLTNICAGRMNFTVLDGKKSDHVIDLPRKYKYQFAISANYGLKTSGMVWATCDISKDGIPMYAFPVKVNHDAPGKTDVRVTWTMACTLQEGIIKGYRVTYCPVVDTSSNCDETEKNYTVEISDPTTMEIYITNLKPYKTYQFTLLLNTSYGIKGLENASTSVTTTEDTPTSPRNVAVSDIQSDSLIISWDPPQPKNGIIGKYVIFNFGQEFHVDKVPDKDNDNDTRRRIKLNGLQGFTNYSLSVQACNSAIGSCSKSSPNTPIFVRTRIGPPSRLKAPKIKTGDNLLKWEPPTIPGGTVDRYQVKIVKDDQPPEIQNSTSLMISLTYCQRVVVGETYQVRALNFDEDQYHGVLADNINALLPVKNDSVILEYPGEWSEPTTVACESRDGLTMALIFISVIVFVGFIYGSIKFYQRCQQREDIKVTLPNGLTAPEKDMSTKFAYGWNPTNNDEKPSSDEMLLLPNSRTAVPSPEVKQHDLENNCGSSDHTDSTALSDTSRGAMERQASTSDDGSDTSLHLEEQLEPMRVKNGAQAENESINSDSEVSPENSPYLNDVAFKKNPASGYVQHVVNPGTGYVQSAPALLKNSPSMAPPPPATTGYVMAGLSPPIFTTGVAPPSIRSHPPTSSGYVRPEDAQTRSMINFPKLGQTPTNIFGPESLPTMPTLPHPAKHGVDSSYIQLQSLDAVTSHKQPVRNSVPLKPPASSGYVSPGDAVINKHMNNMLSAGQLAEESAILDPSMSPDAYCRFSWSTDPANDNLHSFLADSHTINSSKN